MPAKKSRLTLMKGDHSCGSSSSGKIASIGHGSTHAPQDAFVGVDEALLCRIICMDAVDWAYLDA